MIMLLISASPGLAQIWDSGERRWSVGEEERFAAWVEHEVDEQFFLRRHIPIDCADVPYGLRWIYARIARLPMLITTEENRLFGHWSSLFDHLPTAGEWYRDRRFLASLEYILHNTSTRTLAEDSYPIRISADSLMPGAIFLYDGHAGMVSDLITDGSSFSPIQTWEATLPRKISLLKPRDFLAMSGDPSLGTGILRFRWPIRAGGRWQYLAPDAHPYYSLEQYLPDFRRAGRPMEDEVMLRIDPTPYPGRQRIILLIDALHRYLLERVDIVRDGFRHCQTTSCAEGSFSWEMYSTPARDSMIDFRIAIMERLIREYRLERMEFDRYMHGLPLEISADRTISVRYVVDNHVWLSHDPTDSIPARWALEKCPMIQNTSIELGHDLQFSENRYRDIDPEYAERQRQIILYKLDQLAREAELSGCRQPAAPTMHRPARPSAALPIRMSN